VAPAKKKIALTLALRNEAYYKKLFIASVLKVDNKKSTKAFA
jgi:hypothetical protein